MKSKENSGFVKAILAVKARVAALSIGLLLEQVSEDGFELISIKTGETIAGDGSDDEHGEVNPWPAQRVIDYCAAFEIGMLTGNY